MARIVAALGGNALGLTVSEQKKNAAETARVLAELIAQGHELIVSHGNGPQVGLLHRTMNTASPFPLAECTAMTQGYIGYHLQAELTNALRERGIEKRVVSLVTQVVVSPNDPAFQTPTKPIGDFCTPDEAQERMEREPGSVYREDAGRGWRRVVASPEPLDIVEKDAVRTLADSGFVVIACGGGGVPVVKTKEGYIGAEAVIDKDLASERLAELVGADCLLILSCVDGVCTGYGTPTERLLPTLTVDEAERLMSAGEFAPGSMLPKVEAAVRFVLSGEGRRAVIANLKNAASALTGESGTRVSKN